MRRSTQLAFAAPTLVLGLALQTACGGGGGGGSSTPPPTPAPAITAINPTHGSAGATVSLTGTNLAGATSVRFNGTNAFSFTQVSATQVDAVVPSGATSGTITLSTGAGTGTSAAFTVDAPLAPTLTALNPTVGAAGATVTLTGTHFVGASAVSFNGTAATTFTVVSDTQMTAVVPAGATTGTVSVTTPGGTATSGTSFTIGTPVQVMMNADFEQGGKVWGANKGFISKASGAFTPRTGTYFGWLGGYGDGTTDQGWQDINVPTEAVSASLTFYLKVVTSEAGGVAKDTFTVTARTTGGALLGTLLTKSNLDSGATYVQQNLDLLPYKGQVVRVFLNSAEDATAATNFLVDDFAANIIASPTSALAPKVDSFTPTSGVLGEGTLTVTGRNLFGVSTVTIGGQSATFTSVNGTSLTATVPAAATPGSAPISITNAVGTGVSAATFATTYGTATVASVNPSQGPVNTPVVVNGTYLGYPGTTVTLGGTPVTLTAQSMGSLSFTIPAGASVGAKDVVITTPANGITRTFTVNSASSTLDLRVEKVQLTQSTQTLDNTVPVLAGKDGLVRVFVLANTTNTATPSVEVTLANNGVAVAGYPKTVVAPSGSVPQALAEGTLASSWNLAIPGADLTTPVGSGYSVTATVNPGGAITEADTTNNTSTATLTSRTVPTFKSTIFPVALTSGNGDISNANKDAWVARLKKMFPVAALEVTVGSTFTPSVSALTSNNSDNSWSKTLSDLATKHQTDGASDRYYYGALQVSYGSGIAGLGYVPNTSNADFSSRTAIGWDKTGYSDGGNYPEVFAHETGHNMGRPHSPCGGVSGADAAYPYAGGLIGQWGYDSVANVLVNPTTAKDIMGYCTPNWISDYVYKKVLDFRTGTGGFLQVGAEDATPAKELTQATECFLVRGILHKDGSVTFLPGFRTQALPTPVPAASSARLRGVDAQGRELFDQPLELLGLGCGPMEGEQHFLVALPTASTALTGLAQVQVRVDGELKGRKALMAPTPAFEPEALQLPNGRMRLTWDAQAHEAVMVRHPETGEVLAILTGGKAEFAVDAKAPASLEVVLSGSPEAAPRRTPVKR